MSRIPERGTLERSEPPPKRQFSLHRQDSLKGRLLSKVLGLQRSLSAQTTQSPPRNASSRHFRSISDNAARSDLRLSHDFGSRPSTSFIAPTTSEEPSVSNQPISSNVKVNLRVTPEVDKLDADTERSIWVAVEATSTVEILANSRPRAALDIAFILDNSIHTSPSAFRGACRIICQIERSLLTAADRTAIICPSSPQPKDDAGIWAINRHLARPILEESEILRAHHAYRAANTDPRHEEWTQYVDWKAALNAAVTVLKKGSQELISRQPHNSIIVILSSTAGKHLDSKHFILPFPLYIVQPGLVPWNFDFQSGWLSTSCLSTSSTESSIQGLIDRARGNTSVGYVNNLKIEVASISSECSIEQIIGKQTIDVLASGYTTIIMVKVYVKAAGPPKDTRTMTTSQLLMWELEGILGLLQTGLLSVTATHKHSHPQSESLTGSSHVSVTLPRPTAISPWSTTTIVPLPAVQLEELQDTVYKNLMMCLWESTACPFATRRKLEDVFRRLEISEVVQADMKLLKAELEYQEQICALSKRNPGFSPGQPLGIGGSLCHEEYDTVHAAAFKHYTSSSLSVTTASSTQTVSRHNLNQHNNSSVNVDPNPQGIGTAPKENEDKARKIWKHMRQDSKGKAPTAYPYSHSAAQSHHNLPSQFSKNPQQSHDTRENNQSSTTASPLPRPLALTLTPRHAHPDVPTSPLHLHVPVGAEAPPRFISAVPDPATLQRMRNIRTRALRSQRSIGADTLRSLAEEGGRGGPWL